MIIQIVFLKLFFFCHSGVGLFRELSFMWIVSLTYVSSENCLFGVYISGLNVLVAGDGRFRLFFISFVHHSWKTHFVLFSFNCNVMLTNIDFVGSQHNRSFSRNFVHFLTEQSFNKSFVRQNCPFSNSLFNKMVRLLNNMTLFQK